MTTTINATAENIASTQIETSKTGSSMGQICFGATMAIGTLYGMWALVSFMFSYIAG